MKKLKTGLFLYPGMTMLDAYGPLQFLAFVRGLETFTFAESSAPLPCDAGIQLVPDYSFEDRPEIDILLVPGAGNPLEQMQNPRVLEHLRQAGENAQYVTSVCSGALILAEAGLLDGYEAATHWAYRETLEKLADVTVVNKRVSVDRNRITGGGVTAGIDFALSLTAELFGPEEAQLLQLMFEYHPEPPFNSGSPETASAEAVKIARHEITSIAPDLMQYAEERSIARTLTA
ncbi:DJ-1/PfpI family protein [Pseudovibrio sp. SCP19]|uniref:DJ-1/PfpI family protein n=1 Tax=Pseudovibrio sp. SCP19 TaxID=3141374 RepID=UPI00333BE70A